MFSYVFLVILVITSWYPFDKGSFFFVRHLSAVCAGWQDLTVPIGESLYGVYVCSVHLYLPCNKYNIYIYIYMYIGIYLFLYIYIYIYIHMLRICAHTVIYMQIFPGCHLSVWLTQWQEQRHTRHKKWCVLQHPRNKDQWKWPNTIRVEEIHVLYPLVSLVRLRQCSKTADLLDYDRSQTQSNSQKIW